MFFFLACTADPPAAPPVVPPPPAPAVALPEVGPEAPVEAGGVRWTPLLRAGQAVGDTTFGTRPQGKDGLDGQTLHKVGDAVWLVSHFEVAPAQAWRTELDLAAGTALRTSEIPSEAEGLNYCAATRTPWGTHLGSQEYEPDAAIVLADGRLPERADRGAGETKIHDEGYNELTTHSPYAIGWMWEAAPTEGAMSPRRALGRFSHEIGRVMGDGRTVYLTDDLASGAVLFLFTADHPNDLSAGRLYAAQIGETLRWVPLGHARAADLDAAMATPPKFADLFVRTLGADCPAPGVRVKAAGADECLAVQPGMDMLASRLESRRYAVMKGATATLQKVEGATSDGTERLWLAAGQLTDPAGAVTNPCGGILELPLAGGQVDTAGEPIDSAHVATAIRTLVAGVPDGDRCASSGLSNPDNVVWAEGHDTLLIAEDTHRRADGRSWLWTWKGGTLTPIFVAPGVNEFTGLDWNPELDTGTLAVQGGKAHGGFVGLLRLGAQ